MSFVGHWWKDFTGVFSGGKAPQPPAAPAVPNANDAANASQAQADQMRQRRGLMANIYGGAQGSAPPVSGKTSLGS